MQAVAGRSMQLQDLVRFAQACLTTLAAAYKQSILSHEVRSINHSSKSHILSLKTRGGSNRQHLL